jgi:chromate transporter
MSTEAALGSPAGDGDRVHLLSIFLVFLKMGAFSFGGGLTGWVFQEVVTLRRWMAEDEFMSGLALCQVLPGTNITNISVFVGMRLRGIAGAVVAVFALLFGPFLAVIALGELYTQVAGVPWISPALDGISAAAVGLLLLVGFKGSARAARKVYPLVFVAATAVMVGILQWPLLPVVVGVAPFSIAAAWPRPARHA